MGAMGMGAMGATLRMVMGGTLVDGRLPRGNQLSPGEDHSFSLVTSTIGVSEVASTVTTIGRQQTSQSSTYCWRERVVSINSSTGSPQYGHRTEAVSLAITATPFVALGAEGLL